MGTSQQIRRIRCARRTRPRIRCARAAHTHLCLLRACCQLQRVPLRLRHRADSVGAGTTTPDVSTTQKKRHWYHNTPKSVPHSTNSIGSGITPPDFSTSHSAGTNTSRRQYRTRRTKRVGAKRTWESRVSPTSVPPRRRIAELT
eukprot:72210-Rhodomonas_salina.1